ncbi:MAG: hypothetical protein ACTHJ4_06225 [Candidatus Nucleicultricaceae bacterium]
MIEDDDKPSQVLVDDSAAEERVETPKYKDYEIKAMEQGWVPLDRYKGDIADFKGAKAFLKDGMYIGRYEHQTKKIEEMDSALKYLVEQNKKLEEKMKSDALEQLKLKQMKAAEIGDSAQVARLTDEITKSYQPPANLANLNQNQYQQEVEAAKAAFRQRNAWYDATKSENEAMINYAHEKSRNLLAINPELTPNEHFSLIEKSVKDKFFKEVNSAKVEVESGVNFNSSIRKKSINDLPAYHRQIVKQLEKSIKGFKIEDYIKKVEALGEM